jgi:hypothetical protein
MSTETNDTMEGCGGGSWPSPQKEHEWLKQYVGEWESDGEAMMGPDQPPAKLKGVESAAMVGGFWIVSRIDGGVVDVMPYQQVYTIGYDPEKGKYIGTIVDSMSSRVGLYYDGVADEKENKLVMYFDGPTPDQSAQTTYRETTVMKTPDHKHFTSEMKLPDGSWVTTMTIHVRRKK